MKTSETQVENMLVKKCRELKIRQHKGGSNGNIGFPDRVVYNHYTKKILHVEVKFNKNGYGQTRKQKSWQNTIEASGGEYFLISGEEEMKEFIKNNIEKGYEVWQDME